MSETAHLAFLRDKRLADVATAALPAWLWGLDASRILWANAVGAALFGAPTVAALRRRRFDPQHAAAQQVARLGHSLRSDGAPRLERLRGFAPRVGRLLTCSCRRLADPEGTPAILIVATEAAGPSLPPAERIRRLLDGFDGLFAAFSPDGELLHAAPEVDSRLGGTRTIAAVGAARLAAAAIEVGRACGETAAGLLSLERIGAGNAAILLATFPPAMPIAPGGAVAPAGVIAPVTPAASDAAFDRRGHEAAAPFAAATPGAPAADASPAPENPPDSSPAPRPERRHPLRFVWQTDADGRFAVASEDFVQVMGPQIAALLGRPWDEIAAELGVDADGRLAQALASRDTFSGIAVALPVEGTAERIEIELSGLPLFERGRSFRGYRGFGICRDVPRLASRDSRAGASVQESPRAGAANASPTPAGHGSETHDVPPASRVTAAGPKESRESPQAAPVRTPERPPLTIVPGAKNVVPFRPALPNAAEKRPTLTPVERSAFQEIAKALGARGEGGDVASSEPDADSEPSDAADADPQAAGITTNGADVPDGASSEPGEDAAADDGKRPGMWQRAWPRPIPSAYAAAGDGARLPSSDRGNGERAVLDRLPVGVLIYRGDLLLHANRALLDWTGYEDVEAIAAAGGLERLFAEPALAILGETAGSGRSVAIVTRRGESLPVEGRLFSVPWHDGTALLIVLVRTQAEQRIPAAYDALSTAEARIKATEAALAASDQRLRNAERALRSNQAATGELESVLETATDGVLVVDRDGIIRASNRSAEALFGYESHEITSRLFVDLFAPESHRTAHDYLNGLKRDGVASVLNDGREVIGRVRQGGLIPLFMTIGRVADDKFCVVFRDITQWKRAEEDLTNAKREAEKASSAKSDFLAKVSHEIRTPLNAIIGFAEVMMEERFGPIGNDRYCEYVKDIRMSGEHVISLVNDLLDLAKIEAGKLELTFVSVNLNDSVQQCVAIMQPQANRERIIIRTSLASMLPPVVADERSIRQIVLNLVSNSIKFTGAGGQVIVSTALTDQGEAVLRVRDTGIGMSEKEIETALEPFRQIATSGRSGSGTGLGLPLTKVLAEANRASFTIKSAIDAGTLVEIAFPATRVLAE